MNDVTWVRLETVFQYESFRWPRIGEWNGPGMYATWVDHDTRYVIPRVVWVREAKEMMQQLQITAGKVGVEL